jgi:S1-C subfamily serine protease
VVISALIFGMVSSLMAPTTHSVSSVQREPARVDLVNAHYRPSEWNDQQQQFITPTPVANDIIVSADAEYQLLENLYERTNPSVVNIEIASRFHSESDIIDSSGSGFVLDVDGHIITNAHVVRDAEEILVTFFDGAVSEAELVGYDDYSDLAVIKVDPSGLTLVPVLLGDSNALRVGQHVIAIGNPFGLQGSMTQGIVSALGRTLPSAQLLDPNYQGYNNPSIIQVDAAVNPGNSGGPLLDIQGNVVGINTAIRTESGTFAGIAFAVPVNTIKRIVPQLIETGNASYSWLGITSPGSEPGLSMASLADELQLPVRYGVLIQAVEPGSPAEVSGLQGGDADIEIRGLQITTGGDIIVAINSTTVHDIDELMSYLVENTSPGDRITLTIVRNGETLDLDVELGERPGNNE